MKKEIEFALTGKGRVLVVSETGPSYLSEDIELINDLYERIKKDFPEAFKALAQYYRASQANLTYYRYRIVRKFVACNFGSYDDTKNDIDENCNLNFERVHCPARGECPLENIVCNPIFASGLSKREEEVVKIACSGMTANEIADQMCVSVHTVRTHMNMIIKKLGYHSFKEVIQWWHEKGSRSLPQ